MLIEIMEQLNCLLSRYQLGSASLIGGTDVLVTVPAFTIDVVHSIWSASVYEFSHRGLVNGILDVPLCQVSEDLAVMWLQDARVIICSQWRRAGVLLLERLSRPMLPRALCLAIGGPSGAGKTTLVQNLKSSVIGNRIRMYTAYTTRLPRQGEIDGRDYYFIDPIDLSRYQNDPRFANFVEARGNWYWSKPVEFFRSRWNECRMVYIFMLTQVHEFLDRRITVPDMHWVWIDADDCELRRRLEERGDVDVEKSLMQNRRLAKQDRTDLVDIVIHTENGDLDLSTQKLLQFIRAQLEGEES